MGLGLRFGLKNALAVAALAAAGLLAPASALAERITLKNGHEIKECWILEESRAQIVIAVIRGANIGKITLDPASVESIDRTREITLEEALQKARKALEEEQRRRELERAAAAALATQTAGVPGGAPGASGAGGSKEAGVAAGSRLAALVGPTTPEEEEKIAAAIQAIGDTRNQGGAATRRENALKELVQIGPKAIGALTKALGDDVSYRRMNAARAVGEIAKADGRVAIYEEAIPQLIKLLYDSQPWVRLHANKALEALSGLQMDYPEPKGEDLAPGELAAIDKWGKWWDAQRVLIQAQ
jgi:hypothetical protein